ncbi:MAG: lytic transglycosylase domain-containing protein [Geminicoccaceae bacterium]
MQAAGGTIGGMTTPGPLPLRLSLLALFALALTLQPSIAEASQPARSCLDAVRAAERRAAIPSGLLLAVAVNESGRWDRDEKQTLPWPWTVNNGGDGRHFDTKEEAIRWVEELRSMGRTNIDVGCMQINLHHHPEAFPDLDAAFDPVRNVAYGAKFLGDLRDATGSWPEAVGRYHSADLDRGRNYRERVYARLDGLEQSGSDESVKSDRRLWSWTRVGKAEEGASRPPASIGVFEGTGGPKRASVQPSRATPGLLPGVHEMVPTRAAPSPQVPGDRAPVRFFPLRTAANGGGVPGYFRIQRGS